MFMFMFMFMSCTCAATQHVSSCTCVCSSLEWGPCEGSVCMDESHRCTLAHISPTSRLHLAYISPTCYLAGMLICLCSRNEEIDVQAVLTTRRDEMSQRLIESDASLEGRVKGTPL